jgi:glucosamine kinase
MTTKIYVGIDGGGTHTTALATDALGRELARLQGDAGLVRSTDPTAGAAALADLTERVLTAAGASLPATGLCCALAGAGREEDQLAIAAALQREAVTERARVITDADAAFHDAFATGPGILLIAGTGSIALGRNAASRTARVGGWGALLGDEGSGYALGLAALRASVRAHDGRAPETALLPGLLAHLVLGSPDDLIHWTTAAGKRKIAALAPLVLEAAAAGDNVACAAVAEAARDLAAHVQSLHHHLRPWPAPARIALAGGLIAPGGPLRPALLEEFALSTAEGEPAAPRTPDSEFQILERAVDAARGAAALAREP